jgi:hypothetical protein
MTEDLKRERFDLVDQVAHENRKGAQHLIRLMHVGVGGLQKPSDAADGGIDVVGGFGLGGRLRAKE